MEAVRTGAGNRRGVIAAALAMLALVNACGDETLTADPTHDNPATTAGDGGGQVSVGSDGGGPAVDPGLEPLPTTATPVADARLGPPYPVVLVHGLNGFRDVGPLEYFFRVPASLEADGQQVFVTAVAPYSGSAHRAALLAPQIDEILRVTNARKVNLIAHSQGGVDSRYLISSLGYGDRVASLTTISTPHRGTPVADAIGRADGPVADGILNAYAFLFGALAADAENDPDARAALETLSVVGMEEFNRHNADDPRVQYFSFAGRSNLQSADSACAGERPNPDAVDALEIALLPTWLLLAGSLTSPEPSDGLVPVASAKWGRFMGCLPADHLDEIGQLADLFPELISGWDHVAFYVNWVRWLRQQGL